MANYLIQPKADYDADSNDVSNALIFLGVSKPATISGLANGTEYIAREFVLSPPSESFIPGIDYTITVVGLIDGEARQGEEISLSIDPAITTETVTYQWQANGSDIGSATTATEVVDIGGVHTDGQSLRCVVTIDGAVFVSNAAPMRYAPGTLSIADQSAWTVDDTSVNLDASASGANLTFSYAVSGLPAGLSINASSGAISGTPTAVSSGTATVTATDQYGRELTDNFTWSAVLRTQATAANGLSDPDWIVDDTTVNVNAASDFIANGNDLTYVITGLPTGLADDGDGTISGTPTVNGQSGTVTITATDEYDRETVSTFTFTTSYRTQATAADGLGPFSWTVDDTTVNVNAASDFTANGNDLTYTATGLPAGVSIASNGTISGTPTAASSGSIVITGTDEYGRETTSTTSHTTALRAQATGGADLDLSFTEDGAITSTDLVQNWTANGNTLSFVSVSPSLPAGLSINSSGVLSGTPTTVTSDATYTLTMEDEYGRETSDTFTLEITEGFTISLTGLSTDSLGDYAEVGDHAGIGYEVDPPALSTAAYAANGINPELVADFAGDAYFSDSATTSTFADLFTFSRASTATYVDSSGAIQTAASGTARTGHHVWDGSAWVNKGLLLESEARTNLLLNSGTLSTQDVTVSAVQYALHFTGSGSITLSGAHSATLNGTGSGEQNRVSLVFTPSAGTLTLTVSGAVENAQLEEVSERVPYPSSYIPTAGATVTRAGEDLWIEGANMPAYTSAFSVALLGAIDYAKCDQFLTASPYEWVMDVNNSIAAAFRTDGPRTGSVRVAQKAAGAVDVVEAGDLSPGQGVAFRLASRHTSSAIQAAILGTASNEDTGPVALPDLSLDVFRAGLRFMGTIERLIVWNDDIGTTGIEEVTA